VDAAGLERELEVSKVLVVEDHPNLLQSLGRGLERSGYDVLTAETGEAGYELALAHGVDAVVLDLMLPGRSGFEVLHDLRQAGFQAPVLILSAKDSREDRQRARECGADDYLIKPFAFPELITRLKRLLPPDTRGGAD